MESPEIRKKASHTQSSYKGHFSVSGVSRKLDIYMQKNIVGPLQNLNKNESKPNYKIKNYETLGRKHRPKPS
jgi:hypothetical protein